MYNQQFYIVYNPILYKFCTVFQPQIFWEKGYVDRRH